VPADAQNAECFDRLNLIYTANTSFRIRNIQLAFTANSNSRPVGRL
jgi:hypothetical protein